MKKVFNLFVFASVLVAMSCAKDSDILGDPTLVGNINGVVKDYTDGHLISNCNISLSPDNMSCVTGTDGTFSFSAIKSGLYTLAFKKAGYEDASRSVSVSAGKTIDASVTLTPKGAFSLSETNLAFGDFNSSLSVIVTNNTDTQCSFEISNVPSWATFSSLTGTVGALSSISLSVSVDRDKVDFGNYTQNVNIKYSGRQQGTVTMILSMQKVKQSVPQMSIAANAEIVTEDHIVIGGSVVATGGTPITSYGHCWSLIKNPTIDDNKNDYGGTTETKEFKSTIEGLSPGTVYHIRAYATNALGTSYSDEIIITTQEGATNRWDGNIAQSFSGGSGTYGDPYQIRSGGELMLMAKTSSEGKYYLQMNNINLDNLNWKPFEFLGNFDGGGHTISNLRIERNEDRLGLFSIVKNSVKNVTLKGVYIKGQNYIGAISGECLSKATISDVHVIFSESSLIQGSGDFVGGVCGSFISSNKSGISYCNVESVTDKYIINGKDCVGGVVGYYIAKTEEMNCVVNSIVNLSITGAKNVGGIVGYFDSMDQGKVQKCGFVGNIMGTESLGGIVGWCRGGAPFRPLTIAACKSIAHIEGNDNVGGLLGKGFGYSEIISSYSDGEIKSSGNASGFYNGSSSCALSYSTMFVNGVITPKITGTVTPTQTSNITTFLKEEYSDYSGYYNFNSTWIWEGKINDKTIKVSCPHLAWESASTSSKRRFKGY